MPLLQWSEEFSLNVPDVDAQHRQFVAYINQLYELRRQKCTPAEIGKLIGELLEYARVHFQTEERYFGMFSYPEAGLHQGEHERILRKLQEFKVKADTQADLFLAMNLAKFLKEWLEDHIARIDRKFCKLLLEKDLHG